MTPRSLTEEIQEIRRSAWQAGFERGYQQGLRDGSQSFEDLSPSKAPVAAGAQDDRSSSSHAVPAGAFPSSPSVPAGRVAHLRLVKSGERRGRLLPFRGEVA